MRSTITVFPSNFRGLERIHMHASATHHLLATKEPVKVEEVLREKLENSLFNRALRLSLDAKSVWFWTTLGLGLLNTAQVIAIWNCAPAPESS